ncbi:PfkB family carbohydrate kinase [Chitinophaga nivalis]|uniref:PfkB family carbohydrate kinase n=1 Tax=Chitinophaga nivalis TaxID=2991709 RepID=A0ABT3IKK2_9BACT|nr:PfkB family carbohydrate kinase [Chitinophaga nivalis]MCW3466010.1 PfkB family carbohydrate kinase [Chitinophaga nivalis]MCW3484299.1 PfkB family carbohydrate kinase [Chitinophaga nivalis]
MDQFLTKTGERKKHPAVLVVGDLILDVCMKGNNGARVSSAVIPAVEVDEVAYIPGGAAFTAVCLARAGANVTLLGAGGNDPEKERLVLLLQQEGVAPVIITSPESRTCSRTYIMAGEQLIARYDTGTATAMGAAAAQHLQEILASFFSAYDVVVLADYNKGVLTTGVIDCLEQLKKQYPVLLVAETGRPDRYRSLQPVLVKTSAVEVAPLLLPNRHREEDIRTWEVAGKTVYALTGADITTINSSKGDAMVYAKDELLGYYAASGPVRPKLPGAGDPYLCTFLMTLLQGSPAQAAAVAAASHGSADSGIPAGAVTATGQHPHMVGIWTN